MLRKDLFQGGAATQISCDDIIILKADPTHQRPFKNWIAEQTHYVGPSRAPCILGILLLFQTLNKAVNTGFISTIRFAPWLPTLRSEALAETSFLVYACLYVCVYVLLQFCPFYAALQDDCMPILYFKHVLEIFRIFESDAFGRVGIMIAACQCRRWRQDRGRMESPTVQKFEDTSLIRQILSQ